MTFFELKDWVKIMTQTQEIELQQGLWIQQQWLIEAGLDDKVQIVIQEGEIRIISAAQSAHKKKQEAGWDVFLSLEKDAPTGDVKDVSTNHDNYLYQK